MMMNEAIALPETPIEIRSFRRSRGLKQDALAHILDVDQATISRWESGRSPIDRSVLCRLREADLAPRQQTRHQGLFADTDLDNVWPSLLRFFRSSRGISQEQLADILNITAHSVCRWEGGKYKPDLGAQIRLRDLIVSPLESDSEVRCLVDRIKASRSRANVNWGPMTLAWSRPLRDMYEKLGRRVSALSDVTKIHDGMYEDWWTEARRAGFPKGEIPFAVGFWQYSQTDMRKIMAFPAGTYEGSAVWVTVHRPFDIAAAGRSNGEVILKHADEIVG